MARKVLVAALLVATVAGFASVAIANHGGFHAQLEGSEEVPAISTGGVGSFRGTLVDAGGDPAIRYRLEYSGSREERRWPPTSTSASAGSSAE